MCLTLIDCERTEVVELPIPKTPVEKIVAAVRERARARKLNFVQADVAVQSALDRYMLTHSLPISIDCGQRKADDLARKPVMHSWRGSNLNDFHPGAA